MSKIGTLEISSSGNESLVQVGSTFTGFCEEVVSNEARTSVRQSSIKILAGALSNGPGSTGLVVGRVQSGKTLSYEGVVSLARDNGFAVVVVISGVSNPLLTQGTRRLRRDLGRADSNGWTFIEPADTQMPTDYVENELIRIRENWRVKSTPRAYKQTAVIFLLKHYGRIRELAEMFARLSLGELPVLVIDDEADQASLNTLARRNRESSVFTNIRALRDALPNHYYLQYTATPQAPLLIAIQSALSPDFVRVLEPGENYTGGEAFFEEQSHLVRTISDADIDAVDIPNGPPPDGLREAMQEFLIGATHVVASGHPETRSMLVHPSRQTDPQGVYTRWIRSMKQNWQQKYDHSNESEPTKMKNEFWNSWKGLIQSFPQIVDFEDCWNALGLVFRNLEITEVNTSAGRTPIINWEPTKSYILVGGQAIDRGFTVEGLTVTYMPRGAGMSVADTIQQRARFFGYKSSYLGLCRVYLEPVVRDAFEHYVLHEREMLKTLREIEAGQDSLKEWKRRFLLDPSMRPTRANVIGIETIRITTHNRWITDRYPVREDAITLSKAEEVADSIFSAVTWERDTYGHLVGRVSVLSALEFLESISPESFLGEEGPQALQLALAQLADKEPGGTPITIFWMRGGNVGRRSELEDGSVQIFQGRGGNYPGDTNIFDPSTDVTVQIHRIEVQARAGGEIRGRYLVPAWRISENAGASWIVQV